MKKLILNALWVYKSYLNRTDIKPFCSIPTLVHSKPYLFDEKLRTCECKYQCRYDNNGGGSPEFLEIPDLFDEEIRVVAGKR